MKQFGNSAAESNERDNTRIGLCKSKIAVRPGFRSRIDDSLAVRPNILILCFFAIVTHSSSMAAPTGPISEKPPPLRMTNLTPFRPHSSITGGTEAAGIGRWTTSTSVGTSRIDLYAFTPRISPTLGLMG